MSTDLKALTAAGLTTRQIAERLGISIGAAQRRMRRASITPPSQAAAAETRDTVARLTRQGLTAAQIGEQLGIGARQVLRHRTAAGVTKPSPSWWTPEQIKIFEHAITVDGWSYGEVSRTYGVHKATLAQHWPGRGWTHGGGITYRRMIERVERVDAEYWANRYARGAGQNRTRAAA